jgi:DNA-binding transcriptional regulator YiaG
MPSIATLFKQEILRLARKEVKTQTEVIRKASAQYRRDIAQLKRQVAGLSKQVAHLERQERRRATTPVPASKAEGRRFSARGLRTHREKIGFSAADYSALVGVTAQTIYSWEQGKSRPREGQLAALVTVREMGKREALKRLDLLQG